MSIILKVNELKFKYSLEKPYILNSINLEVRKNSITAIGGLSGCGKSTLAFLLCGIIPKSIPGKIEGDIYIEDENIKNIPLPSLAKRIAMVFQEVDNQLFLPTVESEIAFSLENYQFPYDYIDNTVTDILSKLNIEYLRYKNPALLSGGEKSLVAIASILALEPDIIILDEVLSSLDNENRNLIIDTIKLLKKSGKTVVFIDHSIENLMIADYIYLMKDGKIDKELRRDKDSELLYDRLNDFFLSQI